jgi:cell division protein FtsB
MYFSFHAVQGERGVLRLLSSNTQLETLSSQSDNLEAQREELERKVAMMRPGSVDRDLLEERVRGVLGYKHADEYAILSH